MFAIDILKFVAIVMLGVFIFYAIIFGTCLLAAS